MADRTGYERYESAVTALRTNGAWLIEVHDPTGDATPDALFSCAAGLTVAKRVGKHMAEELGYERPMMWHPHADRPGWFDLSAYWCEADHRFDTAEMFTP